MLCYDLMKIPDYLCMIFNLYGTYDCIATWLIAEYRMFLIQKYPLCSYVWGYAPYNPSTANQLKCSLLRLSISLDSWFRLVIPYSQLTLVL